MRAEIQAIINEVEKFNDSIREALDSKGISDTREAANSLRIEFENDFVRSIGIFYLEFLDTGRGPGKPPPFKKILEWAMRRTGQPKNEVWGLAVYVTNKIAEVGTAIFQNNSKGIELDKKIVTLREGLNQAISESVKIEINQRLDRFKKIAKQKYQI